jgi:peptide deformylase
VAKKKLPKGEILPVRIIGDETLRRKAELVIVFDEAFDKFLSDLAETMYHRDGVGLAAPQVGRSLRVFVIDPDHSDEEKRRPRFFINPRIVESEGTQTYEEGCISLPEIYEKVRRPSRVVIEATDEKGETTTWEFNDYLATVIQHEYDHLDGVLFVDRLPKLTQLTLRKRIRDLESRAEDGVNYRIETD